MIANHNSFRAVSLFRKLRMDDELRNRIEQEQEYSDMLLKKAKKIVEKTTRAAETCSKLAEEKRDKKLKKSVKKCENAYEALQANIDYLQHDMNELQGNLVDVLEENRKTGNSTPQKTMHCNF